MAKILVVDDSQTIRLILKKSLEEAQFTIQEAVDGLDGIKKLTENGPFDLLISDINMPNLDGIGMMSQIRQMPQYAKLPMMVLSTEVAQDMKAKGKELGVIAWVIKPPNTVKMIEVINKILGKT